MSIEKQVFKGASWLALFRFISQIFSWSVTIIVARILTPADYGLKEMASIVVGYALLFNELGLGAAIIHRQSTSEEEMSSVFWLSIIVSSILAVICFSLAYPLSWFFHEPRIVPLAMTISILFPIGGLQVVPLSLIKKRLDFKFIGKVEMVGTLLSSISVLVLAYLGAGVWALIAGTIVLGLVTTTLYLTLCQWRPRFYFDFKKAKSFFGFGVTMSIGESLHYIFETSDRFFAGRAWTPKLLGYYTFAMDLATIPLYKITSLINQVSFPAFSKLQHDTKQFNDFYLKTMKISTALVLPIYVGGFLLTEELVRLFLDTKWLPIVFLLKFLCLVQIITILNAINNFVHAAQGRPLWRLWFYGILAVAMAISFFFAVQHGLNAILVPWFTTYLVLCVGWIMITLRKIGISLGVYCRNLSVPFVAVAAMIGAVLLSSELIRYIPEKFQNINVVVLIIKAGCAFIGYSGVFWLLDRNSIKVAINLIRKK